MDQFDFYILDDNNDPKKVSRFIWEHWMRNSSIYRICIAETHLIHIQTRNVATTVTTVFTGCDTTPYAEEAYLWETRAAYFREVWRYTSMEKARDRHEDFVSYVFCMLTKDNFKVERRDIEIHQITTE